MPVPTYDKFIEPVLRYLNAHPGGAHAAEVSDAAAISLGLSDTEKQELLPSGQRRYKNRAGWAHDRLKRAGLSASPRHGFWQITPSGTQYVAQHPAMLSEEEVDRLASDFMEVRLTPTAKISVDSEDATPEAPAKAALASPDDRLGEALGELRRIVANQVLELLMTTSPSFFEEIVLNLVHKMGYGAALEDQQLVGGPGDAGIDGVISLDKLGLEKIYIQAKRWQQPVGRPEIQGFSGALQGQRARKGVFITTSTFTPQAVEYAKSIGGLALIDGQRLAHLMIDHEMGVSARTVRVPKIDRDYFDEE